MTPYHHKQQKEVELEVFERKENFLDLIDEDLNSSLTFSVDEDD